jgi:hypothetical protein
MKYKLLVDCHSDRIVFFTDNIDQELTLDDNVYVCYSDKELPEDMSLSNCWNWKWNSVEETLFVPEVKVDKKDVFEHNKESVRFTLKTIINNTRRTLYDDYVMDEHVRLQIFKELRSPKEQQFYLSSIAEIQNKTLESVVEFYKEEKAKFDDIMFLTEVTKKHFQNLIDLCETPAELYKIRNDIAASNILKKYEDIKKQNLTLINKSV